MNLKKNLRYAIFCFTLIDLAPALANAAGFQLNEQSAASVGMALAGTAVEPDASVQFANPAGIAALSGLNVLGGGNLYLTTVNFHGTGTKSALGTPLAGNASADSNNLAPYGYLSYQIDDRFTVGLAAYSPFGLATRYSDNSSVRYFAETSAVTTVEINPNIAVRLDDQFSIGAGPAIRYTHGEFSNAIDDGAIGTAAGIGAGLPPAAAAALGRPEANDARFRAEGDGWDLGYKAGVLWQPDKETSVGIDYHSAMQTTISGNSTIDNSGVRSPLAVAFATSPLGPRSTPVTAKLDYPDSVTLSGSHQLNSRLRLTGDVAYVNWSRFKELNIQFADGAPTASSAENFTDSYRFAVGAEYQLLPHVKLRGGTAYETSPIGGDDSRTPRVPDSDRFWLSGGVGWEFMTNASFDFGYSHLFAIDGGSFQSSTTAGQLIGDYENDSADILSVDVAYRF